MAHTDDWREVVYTPEIDSLLATLALEDENPAVAEASARAIGRIRSEAAVHVLAEKQKAGDRRALRALALVRDEAPSLPKSVTQQARLYAWLTNTWRRITNQPLRWVTRYLFAALFSAIVLWWWAYSNISSIALFVTDRWGLSVTDGITFGVFVGVVVLLAGEVPERLRGFWSWWACLVLNLVLGVASGTLLWIVFHLFFLHFLPAPGDEISLLIGGLGAALAFSPRVLFRIPGWLGAIWAAVALYLPLYVTWINFMPPLINTRPGEDISMYGVPIAILMAVGAYLPHLVSDVRGLVRRLRERPKRQTQPAVTAAG